VSPNYTANCTTTATIDVQEITGNKVTSRRRSAKGTKLFCSARERERKTVFGEGRETKENVKCQVQIPIQVPRVFWDLEKGIFGPLSRGDFSCWKKMGRNEVIGIDVPLQVPRIVWDLDKTSWPLSRSDFSLLEEEGTGIDRLPLPTKRSNHRSCHVEWI